MTLTYTKTKLTHFDDINNTKELLPNNFINLNPDSNFLINFLYLRNSSFINFFINNLIDVPICFKKSKSLKTKNLELPLFKICNFLMKQGKKEKTINVVFKSLKYYILSIKNINTSSNFKKLSWLNLYFFTMNTMFYYNFKKFTKKDYIPQTNISLAYNNLFNNEKKYFNISMFSKNFLYILLSKITPVFNYFIYSVDKNIRKYSRGRSGKYTFIWKYIAPYKRTQFAMKLIIKDIKFNQNQKFKERLLKVFDILMVQPNKSFAWKSKIFSHNYVFKNFRKSLMSSLRTTS